MRALKGHELDKAALAFKSGDQLYGTFACRSVDPLIIFGANGRVYSVPVALLPGGRGDGQPITTMIELEAGSQIAHFHAGSAQLERAGDDYLLGQAKAQAFRNGFFDQISQLWDRHGTMLASTHQIVYYKQ